MIQKIRKLLGLVPAAPVDDFLQLADTATTKTTKVVDTYVAPVRNSMVKRFPVMFGLLVTIGVTAMFLGIEQLILKYKFLMEHPELILLSGVLILAFTGRLYTKLSP